MIDASKLEGAELDAAVAVADGYRHHEVPHGVHVWVKDWQLWNVATYHPSTNWAQGGPIIEREPISVWKHQGYSGDIWHAGIGEITSWDDGSVLCDFEEEGPTPLIAAMRAFVASKGLKATDT